MNNPLVIPMTISESTTSFDMSMDMAINVGGNVDVRPLRVTENGTYEEADTAYAPVVVDVEGLVPTGTLNITANGVYDVTEKASADVQVRQPSGTKQINITQNGTLTEDVEWYEDAELTVNVPNTYAQADEGKVVNNGALVGQTSRNITANGTVNTTLNNEVVIAVPNSYTQADEGKVVSSGALVSQTSRTVSDNGTYDTTLNNEVVVNNEDYADALVAFGVEDDLADGIVALTTYSNEITGESDTTLSDAVRTLADGYGGGGGVKPVPLPSAYQQVEYIENTSTSYINTGYEMTSDVTEQSVQCFGRPSSASSIFGAERNSTYSGVLWTASGSTVATNLFIGSTKNVISETLQLGLWHTVTVKTTSATRGSFTVDGYERSFTYSGGQLKGYPIFLFANNSGGQLQNCKIRIARFQITDGGVKVRDLVACYRKADDVIGMYDLVNDAFYTNAGTGTFTKGGDI